jgi:protein involved in polysaccharide export with SLBB domain
MRRCRYPSRVILLLMAVVFGVKPRIAAEQKNVAANIKPAIAFKFAHIKEVNDAYQADLMYANSRYRLGADDVVSFRFPHAPEFNQTVRIEPDGFVNLAGVGDVRIEGLTVAELAESVQLAYSKIVQDPTVIVEIQDFTRPYFLVLGQVNRPGKYDLRGYTSATEALASAGGLKDTARYSQVLLFRHASHDWYEVKPLDFKQLLRGHDFEEDAEVRPGDMLFVPQNLLSKLKRFIP